MYNKALKYSHQKCIDFLESKLMDTLSSSSFFTSISALGYEFWHLIESKIYIFVLVTVVVLTFIQKMHDNKRLRKRLELRTERTELAQQLKAILNKHNINQLSFYRWLIDKSNPIYSDSLECMKESQIVNCYIIECFEEGKIPFLPFGAIGSHPNEARGFILRCLLVCDNPAYYLPTM